MLDQRVDQRCIKADLRSRTGDFDHGTDFVQSATCRLMAALRLLDADRFAAGTGSRRK